MNAGFVATLALASLVLLACDQSEDRGPQAGASRTIASLSGSAQPAPSFESAAIFDFVPEIAEVVATIRDRNDQRVGLIVALQDRDAGTCGDLTTRSMQFVVPDLKIGLKVDLDGLKGSELSMGYAQNAASAETWVMKLGRTPELSADSRIHPEIPWRPTGTLEILEAPKEGGGGKLAIHLANSGFRFEKVLPVRLCVPVELRTTPGVVVEASKPGVRGPW